MHHRRESQQPTSNQSRTKEFSFKRRVALYSVLVTVGAALVFYAPVVTPDQIGTVPEGCENYITNYEWNASLFILAALIYLVVLAAALRPLLSKQPYKSSTFSDISRILKPTAAFSAGLASLSLVTAMQTEASRDSLITSPESMDVTLCTILNTQQNNVHFWMDALAASLSLSVYSALLWVGVEFCRGCHEPKAHPLP